MIISYKKQKMSAVIIACIVLYGIPVFAETAGSNSITSSLSWDLGLKACWEHLFTEQIGIKAGVGTYLYLPAFIADGSFALVQDMLAVIHFTRPSNKFQTGIGLGIPVSSIIWYKDEDTEERQTALMFALGCSFYAGYRSPSRITYRLWLGGGFPVFFDAGEWKTGGTKFLLNFWPDLDIEVVFPI